MREASPSQVHHTWRRKRVADLLALPVRKGSQTQPAGWRPQRGTMITHTNHGEVGLPLDKECRRSFPLEPLALGSCEACRVCLGERVQDLSCTERRRQRAEMKEGVFIWRHTAWPCAGRGCNVDGGWDVFVFFRIA